MEILHGCLYVLCNTVLLFVYLAFFALALRALLSFFAVDEDAWYIRALDLITAPVIFPFRALFDRFGWFEDLPFDPSPLLASLLLFFLVSFLPTVSY